MTARGIQAAVLAALASAVLGAATLAAQAGAKNVRDGVFTSEQALRGKSGYDGVCARCHGVPLTGSQGNGPTLKGPAFLAHWDKDTLGSLYTKIRDTMPLDGAGTLTDEVKLQILAYLLEQNGFPAGTTELPGDVNSLEEIGIQQRGVWDGVFTAAQADRGRQPAARCQGCHGPELAGTDRAPALKGSAFLADWEDGSVNRLYVKIRDTMPPGNTDSVTPEAKLDVLAFLLRENGFPPGSSELTANADALDALQITKKGAEGAGAPNFALVQVVGCLAQDTAAGWTLTNATEPVVTRDDTPTAAALKTAAAKPLGRQTFGLVSVASAKSADFSGHKVEARGLLYRDGSYADLNVTSLKTLAPTCSR